MYNLGLLYLFLFNILSSVKNVFVASLVQDLNPFFVLAISFSMVTLFFLILGYFRGYNQKTFTVIRDNPKLAIKLTLSTALGWISFYIALKLIEPAIVSVTSALCPIVTWVFFSKTVRKEAKSSIHLQVDRIISTIVFFILVFLVVKTLEGKSSIGPITAYNALVGFISAFLCELATVATTIYSREFNSKGISAKQLLSFRFSLTAVIALFAFIATYKGIIPMEFLSVYKEHWPSVGKFAVTVMVGLFGVLIPTLCFQEGVAKTSSMIVAYNFAITPLFVLLMEFFDSDRLEVTVYSMVGIVSISILSLISILIENSPKNIFSFDCSDGRLEKEVQVIYNQNSE